jgi:hypothetical protein
MYSQYNFDKIKNWYFRKNIFITISDLDNDYFKLKFILNYFKLFKTNYNLIQLNTFYFINALSNNLLPIKNF